jgi:transcriptional regulator with XRE-family HTH domain
MATQDVSFPVPHITFGDRLRRLRLETRTTQDGFGDMIGLSGATIAKYELRSERPVRDRVLRNLLTLRFGQPVADWVLDGNLRTTDYELETRLAPVRFLRPRPA